MRVKNGWGKMVPGTDKNTFWGCIDIKSLSLGNVKLLSGATSW